VTKKRKNTRGAALFRALMRLQSVKLSGGMFGKITSLLLAITICITVICVFSSIWWLSLVLVFPLLLIVFYTLKRCFDFADKNPEAAIMEGAELLIHEKMMFAQKKQAIDPAVLPSVFDHQPPENTLGTDSEPDIPVLSYTPDDEENKERL